MKIFGCRSIALKLYVNLSNLQPNKKELVHEPQHLLILLLPSLLHHLVFPPFLLMLTFSLGESKLVLKNLKILCVTELLLLLVLLLCVTVLLLLLDISSEMLSAHNICLHLSHKSSKLFENKEPSPGSLTNE